MFTVCRIHKLVLNLSVGWGLAASSLQLIVCTTNPRHRYTAPPCTAAPFLGQSSVQTIWDGSLCAQQRADPQVISSYTEHGSATASHAFSPSVDSITTHPRPHVKNTIKAPPIPLEQLPKFKSPCIKPAVVKDVCLPETQGASHMVGSICDCGTRFSKQGLGTIRYFVGSHDDEDDRPTGHGPTPTAGSRPRCRRINGHSSPYHPLCNSTVSVNDSPHLHENGTPVHPRVAPGFPHDPHITERETFHTMHSASGGGDPVNAVPTPQPLAISDHDVNAGGHNSTNDSLRQPGPTAIPLPPTTAPEDPPLPTEDDHHQTQRPPTHIDAADVFLGVTQRSSRRRSNTEDLDSLERGVVSDQFDFESYLLPWLNIHAFGPRAKAIIVALALGIVLLGAVAKLSQAVQSQSNAH